MVPAGGAVKEGRSLPRRPDSDVVLRCTRLTKTYGGVQALCSVDLDVRAGEVHCLLGQNGAGKSTLIKIVAGVATPDSGHVEIGGQALAKHTPASVRDAGLAVVHQELSLVPSLSVAANLFLGREPRNWLGFVRNKRLRRDAQEVLTRYELPLRYTTVVGEMPFAYRQLTEIARALSGDLKVLVLDEPTSALEQHEEELLFRAIRHLVEQGVGVLYVTHRLAEVTRLSTRTTILRDGQLVGTYETRDIDMDFMVRSIVGQAGTGRGDSEYRKDGVSSTQMLGRSVAAKVPLLELHNVHGPGLNGVDLVVKAGEIMGLAGISGSGRTEILETLFGLRRTTAGKIFLSGLPANFRNTYEAVRRGVGFVPEDRKLQGLIPEHSIQRNVELPRLGELSRFGLVHRGQSAERAREAMTEFGVKARSMKARISDLSGGNQQKVVFGKWRDPAPKVLLLDEPTAGVDVGARGDIYASIRRLAAQGTAVVLASSEFAELLMLCQSIAVIIDGKVSEIVAPSDVQSEEALHVLAQGGNI